MIGREVPRAEHLEACRMVTVEPCGYGRTTRRHIQRRVEPQAQMIRVNRLRRRILTGIGERRLIVDDRRRPAALRDDEGLQVEAADEDLLAASVTIRLDIALIPGEAEGRVGELEPKKSNSVFAGSPLTATRMFSTAPSDLILTCALAPGRQMAAAAEGTMSNSISPFAFAPTEAAGPPTKRYPTASNSASPIPPMYLPVCDVVVMNLSPLFVTQTWRKKPRAEDTTPSGSFGPTFGIR